MLHIIPLIGITSFRQAPFDDTSAYFRYFASADTAFPHAEPRISASPWLRPGAEVARVIAMLFATTFHVTMGRHRPIGHARRREMYFTGSFRFI